MPNLASCLDKLGVEGPQRKYIELVAKRYRDEGKTATEANKLAIQELLDDTKEQIAETHRQIGGKK